MTSTTTEERNNRRSLRGTVLSDKMAKSVVVSIVRTFKHAKYGKYMQRSKKYHAHDEDGLAKVGDLVEIVATRPLSKTKRWRVVSVVQRASDLALADAQSGAVEGLLFESNRSSSQAAATPAEGTR
jgi:small subunit ribosomal protein S17